ncbi:hypothetical protein N864_01945 [Intrasporangium chromatireducens Q5-1]|uniref:DUF6318 domain-containing protein n=1 Tax=Intrasporangium chromatireducens Q5-1 TaxID=584657 RepID=W9GI86_9MICO|nr:DUF6318 family protein [Intrasporangium chromatireducens]EWT05815.1 hypothetical protein N864_01945 [Intrasporangium chromatireducens Q5-1]
MPPTTASPTTNEDPVLAKIPKEARPETPEGAKAFANFYMKQVNQAFTEAEPSVLEGLASADCKMCKAFHEGAKDLEQRGIHHKGQSIEPTSVSVQQYDDAVRTVLVWTTQHSVPVVDEKGQKVDQTKSGKGIFLATLTFDKRWQIQRLQVAK